MCSSKLGEPRGPPQGSQGVGFRFLAVTSCLGSGFINVALTALRSIHPMDPRCDMAVVDAVATYCCENRSDRVRHVAAQTLKEVCDNDGVSKTDGCRQTAYMSTCLHAYMLPCLPTCMFTNLHVYVYV